MTENNVKIPVYRRGSRGPEVGNIQTMLGNYYTDQGGKVDNAYGQKTHNAVYNWQENWNKNNPNDQISVDGMVGRQTLPRLKRWYESRQKPQAVKDPAAEMKPGEQAAPLVTEKPAAKPQPALKAVDPESPTAGMDYLNSLYTPPEDEEKMRKASLANQRILAVGDALRHLANIHYTIKGASPQKFNQPWKEVDDRYQKEKALRDARNQRYYTYQQAKAAQDAAQDRFEREYGLKQANLLSQNAYRQGQLTNQRDYQQGRLMLQEKLGTAQQKERERHNLVAEKQGQQRIGIASQNSKSMDAYRKWRMGGGGNKKNGVPMASAVGQLTAPSNSTAFKAQKEQLYFKAEMINKALAEQNGWVPDFMGGYKDASGKKVTDPRLIEVGNLKSFFGDKRDYDAALKAIMSNEELAQFARDDLRWTEQQNGGSSSYHDDDDDDGTNLNLDGSNGLNLDLE